MIIDKMDSYIEEGSGNKYFTLVPTDENKDTLKKYEEMWSKIRDLIRSVTNNSDDYGEKYMKIKSNWNDDLFPKKAAKYCNMMIF